MHDVNHYINKLINTPIPQLSQEIKNQFITFFELTCSQTDKQTAVKTVPLSKVAEVVIK